MQFSMKLKNIGLMTIKDNVQEEIQNGKWWNIASFFTELKNMLSTYKDEPKNEFQKRILKGEIKTVLGMKVNFKKSLIFCSFSSIVQSSKYTGLCT